MTWTITDNVSTVIFSSNLHSYYIPKENLSVTYNEKEVYISDSKHNNFFIASPFNEFISPTFANNKAVADYINSVINAANLTGIDYWTKHAYDVIEDTYGDVARVKPKNLLKFGENESLAANTEETVWFRGGFETYATGNDIDTLSSSDSGDLQNVIVEGHTLSGSDLTFVVQPATLNGQNKVILTTPLFRASRIYNNDSTDFAGTVYVYEDDTIVGGVPQTIANIHLQSSGATNQSEKAATSFSSVDYGLITSMFVNVEKKTAANVDFRLKIREFGKVFRLAFEISASNQSGGVGVDFNPYIIVPANADVRIDAESDTNNTAVYASFNSLIALKQ